MNTYVLRFGGIILFALGVVWLFQGIGMLPGSFMTGQTRWAVIGAMCALIGLRMWLASRRRRR
jgi:hypothetical protein